MTNRMKKCVIYGAGYFTCKIARSFPQFLDRIDYIIDNDINKQNNSPQELRGVKIYSINQVFISAETLVLISSDNYADEMMKQLMEKGVDRGKIFFLKDYLLDYIYEVYGAQYKNNSIDIVSQMPNEQVLYVVCPCGIGDTLFVAAMINEYNLQYTRKEKICFIVKENHGAIPDWFKSIDCKIISTELVVAIDFIAVIKQFWKGDNFLYGHFSKNLFWILYESYYSFHGNMIEKYRKLVFGLGEAGYLEKICIENSSKNSYKNLDRTIVIMPYANSTQMLPFPVWEYIANDLENDGWNVLTNVKDDTEEPIQGTCAISTDIDSLVKMCRNVYAVISIRSGLCDVLAMTNTNTKLLVINLDINIAKEWNVKRINDRATINNIFVELKDTDEVVAKEIQDVLFCNDTKKEYYCIKNIE